MDCLFESILNESRAVTSQIGVIMRDAIRKWAYCRCVYSRAVVGDPCTCDLGTLARAEWIREQNRK